jgi:hypothetical protein
MSRPRVAFRPVSTSPLVTTICTPELSMQGGSICILVQQENIFVPFIFGRWDREINIEART